MEGTGRGEASGLQGARRSNVMLAIVSGGAFLASFDGAAVAVALPSISRSLGLGYAQALWIPTLYLLVVASLLLPAGRSADRFGRTTHYAVGLGLFCVGSIAAASAPDQWWLYAGRCCQGVGGALIVTTSAALAVAVSTPERRGRALGFNTMCVYLGAAAGPALGGLLVTTLGWRSIFLFGAAAAALLFAAVRVSGASRRVGLNDGDRSAETASVAGSLTFAVAIAALLLLLTFGPVWGWGSWKALVAAAVAGAAFVLLALRESRSSRPIVDHELYRENRLFVAACAAALLVYAGVFAAGLLTAVDLQVVQGFGAGATGVILLMQPVTMAILAPLAGRWYDRIGSRGLTTTGCSRHGIGRPGARDHGSGRFLGTRRSRAGHHRRRPWSLQHAQHLGSPRLCLSRPPELGLRRAGDQPLRRSSSVGMHPGHHRCVVTCQCRGKHPVRADRCRGRDLSLPRWVPLGHGGRRRHRASCRVGLVTARAQRDESRSARSEKQSDGYSRSR